MVSYSIGQRIFILETFLLKKKSYDRTVRKFRLRFHSASMPSRQYITKLFSKWRETGSVLNRKRKPQKKVLTEEMLADIQARMSDSPRKSSRRLAQECGISQRSALRGLKMLRRTSFPTTPLMKDSGEERASEKIILKTMAKHHQLDIFSKDESQWKEPFFFVQGADLQMGMIRSYIEKNPEPGWEKEIELGKKAVEKINQMIPKPKFFVMCGDLCDAFPDEKPEIRRQQENDFKSIFQKLDPDIPLICLSGNHDVGNSPTANTIESYKSSFGDDYFSFSFGGVNFIVINSQFFKDSSNVKDLAEKHEQWLNEQLDKAKQAGTRTIVFQHIPWFLHDPDEESEYFTVDRDIRKIWLDKFKDAGVVHVFAGHLHRNAGGVYKGMPVTVTTALGAQLGNDQPGLRVVKVFEKDVEQKFYSLDTMPSNITL